MIKDDIKVKLDSDLDPWFLDVINESPNHNVPEGAESHFKVIVVSSSFKDLRVVQRHQKIYSILDEEIGGVQLIFAQANRENVIQISLDCVLALLCIRVCVDNP